MVSCSSLKVSVVTCADDRQSWVVLQNSDKAKDSAFLDAIQAAIVSNCCLIGWRDAMRNSIGPCSSPTMGRGSLILIERA